MDHILKCYESVKTDMVLGRGCTLYDAQGKAYTDFEAGVWCTALGHNHPRVTRAIQAQLDTIVHLGYRYTNEMAEEAAVALLESLSFPDACCTFLSSGSEAVEFGVQAIRRITQRPLLLILSGAYVAAYGSAGTKSPHEWVCFDWTPCATCSREGECDPDCRQLAGIPFDQIGGLVFEPGNTWGQVKFPPGRLVDRLAAEVKQRGGLLVVDEVTTGMGRTGAWFGFEHYGLHPDIVAVGKGLGNGYPVSAVALRRGIADALESSGFRYAQSHQDDPLGCAVAREVIAVMREEGLVERSRRVGAAFVEQLVELARRHEAIKEVRGRGLMIALELQGGQERWSSAWMYRELLARGFLAGYNPAANLVRFYPALVIGESDIARLIAALDEILRG